MNLTRREFIKSITAVVVTAALPAWLPGGTIKLVETVINAYVLSSNIFYTASGDYSTIAGGASSTASGYYSIVVGDPMTEQAYECDGYIYPDIEPGTNWSEVEESWYTHGSGHHWGVET